MRRAPAHVPRRAFLGGGLAHFAALVGGVGGAGCSRRSPPDLTPVTKAASSAAHTPHVPMVDAGAVGPAPRALVSRIADVGPLGSPDANGVRLPPGFSSRVVARTNASVVAGKPYAWHASPDGGATFATDDGGWIYVSNSEEVAGGGGAGALRFDADGRVVDAYAILRGTTTNCSGGATPWQTWLSCEEIANGRVHECDPFGVKAAIVRPALGVFKHEAVAIDPVEGHAYLTEDEPDGCLYRFVPDRRGERGFADLSAGALEVAVLDAGRVGWQRVDDPTVAKGTPTRRQVPGAIRFNGGEGIWWHDGTIFMTTKGDDRIHALDTRRRTLRVVYEAPNAKEPPLFGVDNITVSASGDVLVAEDGGRMRVVALLPSGELRPLLQVVAQGESEITGPAFDPSGTRLYVSSQRGPRGGTTFEIRGPFHERA